MTSEPHKTLEIRPFLKSDVPKLLPLCDQVFGPNFYTKEGLEKAQKLSCLGQHNFSFVLADQDQPLGLRLTYPPEHWIKEVAHNLDSSKWPVVPEDTALFKTIFLSPKLRKQSWARKLSETSIGELQKVKTKAIITYCWKESPGNSSYLYLKKMGFHKTNEYPHFWANIDYLCSGCKQDVCICTALEMIREI